MTVFSSQAGAPTFGDLWYAQCRIALPHSTNRPEAHLGPFFLYKTSHRSSHPHAWSASCRTHLRPAHLFREEESETPKIENCRYHSHFLQLQKKIFCHRLPSLLQDKIYHQTQWHLH